MERLQISNRDLRCNVCGKDAYYTVRIANIASKYNFIKLRATLPFFLCESHEYLYEKMKIRIELMDYFSETISEYR